MEIQELIENASADCKSKPTYSAQYNRDNLGFEINGLELSNELHLCSDVDINIADDSKWEYFQRIFTLAGIEVLNHWQLSNKCWPISYMRLCAENPWWLAKTRYGLITIGWRKRVISIEWDFGNYKVTDDDVTHYEDHIHAWSAEKAVEYLRALRICAELNVSS